MSNTIDASGPSEAPPPKGGAGVGNKAVRGALWIYGEYVIQLAAQGLALIGLARLLTPEDFGIFAICLLFVAVGETVFRFGLGPSIIQRKGSVEGYLETAWTTNNAASIIAVICIGLAAPIINAVFLHEPKANLAVWIMLAAIPLNSLMNPATLLLLKEMKYSKLFWIGLPRNLVRYLGGLILAYWLRSYWALVWAYLGGFVLECILSYIVSRNRARIHWSKKEFLDLYSFSGWLQLNNLIKWFSRYLDSFVAGSVLGTTALGLYNRAQTISDMPAAQMNFVLVKLGFPLFASLQDDAARSRIALNKLVDLGLLTFLPIAMGICVFGHELIETMLGENWTGLVPAMQILTISAALRTLCDVFISMLRARGFSKLEFKINAIRIIVTFAALIPLTKTYGLVGAAAAVCTGVLAAVPTVLFWGRKHLNPDWKYLGVSIVSTVVAVVLVATLFKFTPLKVLDGWQRLAWGVSTGSALGLVFLAFVYLATGIGAFGTVVLVWRKLRGRLIKNA